MKKFILFSVLAALVPFLTLAQAPLNIKISTVKDTIYSTTSQSHYIAKVIIPKQRDYTKFKIIFSINEAKTNVKGLMLPSDLTYVVDDTTKDAQAEFKIIFQRDPKDDRILAFNVKAVDDKDKEIKPIDDKQTSAEVYIKPFPELEKSDNEYWLFIGTNFDLLDGIKAKDLYFRGSFLIPINEFNPRKHQLYITFEKNRFFGERDSLSRIPFSDVIYKPGQRDSITTVNGQYNSFREIVTENLGFSFNYLRNTNNYPGERYNFYVMAGVYIDFQNAVYTYTNHNIMSDTVTSLRVAGKSYIFRPLLTKDRIQYWNNNLYLGSMYIHSGDAVNFKTFLQLGVNLFNFPESKIKTSTDERSFYKQELNFYTRFHLDATFIKSPGVSLGCEVYYRKSEKPLFNFTLTKVFDYRQIEALFTKVPSQ